MDVDLQTVLMVAQTLASISTPIAILLAIRQFRLVRRQAKKQSDTAAVNFILQAEGQFDREIDLGLSEADRADLIADWDRTLRKYRDHPIMRRVYQNAMRNRDYNAHMLRLAEDIFGEAGAPEVAASA